MSGDGSPECDQSIEYALGVELARSHQNVDIRGGSHHTMCSQGMRADEHVLGTLLI